MSWTWEYLDDAGEPTGKASEAFDSRGDAETWVGEVFADLLADGVGQVRLLEDGTAKYTMSLAAE